MTTSGPHEFTLTDANGVEHQYLCTLHGLNAGLPISTELIASGGPALGRLIGAFVGDEGAMKTVQSALAASRKAAANKDGEAVNAANSAMWGALETFARGFDWSQAGLDLQTAIKGLSYDIIPRILACTVRDRTDLKVSLDCYRGNYAELYRAAFKVARLNGFFPVPSSLSGGSKD